MALPSSDVLLRRLKSLHPCSIDLGLERCEDLLAKCGSPQASLPHPIHIAGTNGKGSTLAMLRAGLSCGSGTVHAYTSPHLVSFHERILLRGRQITEPELAALLHEVEAINSGEPITFFEVTTCAAMLAFARTPADYTLLEVGMGGRLDATNAAGLAPRLCIITPVSLDHQEFLGATLEAIAAEKAGILKAGVPAVVGRQTDGALGVIRTRAAAVGCDLFVHGVDWTVDEDAASGGIVFRDLRSGDAVRLPLPGLLGQHQVENAGTAIAALRLLGCGVEQLSAALTCAQWPARLQRLATGALAEAARAEGAELWLDGGHNPAAGVALAEACSRLPRVPTALVCGMLKTKDVHGFLAPLRRGVSEHLVAVPIKGEPTALDAGELAGTARAVGFAGAQVVHSLHGALKAAANTLPRGERRVLICGSLYLAGEVLRENGGDGQALARSNAPSLPRPLFMGGEVEEVSAYLCLGANLGHRARHMSRALVELRSCGRVVRVSALYITAPQHVVEQVRSASQPCFSTLSPSSLAVRPCPYLSLLLA